jgi:hypothetical protein
VCVCVCVCACVCVCVCVCVQLAHPICFALMEEFFSSFSTVALTSGSYYNYVMFLKVNNHPHLEIMLYSVT